MISRIRKAIYDWRTRRAMNSKTARMVDSWCRARGWVIDAPKCTPTRTVWKTDSGWLVLE